MSEDAADRFVLRRITEQDWFIVDTRFGPGDPRGLVARIERQDEASVRLFWTGDFVLCTEYLDPETALEDLRERASRPARSTRPIPIPSFSPRRRQLS